MISVVIPGLAPPSISEKRQLCAVFHSCSVLTRTSPGQVPGVLGSSPEIPQLPSYGLERTGT